MDLILAAATRPFAVAIGVMLLLALLEVVFMLFGQGLSEALDALLPDIDGTEASGFNAVLSFFGFGSVPVLVVLIAFLTLFGLAGFIVQAIVFGLAGSYLPAAIASIPALIVALPGTRRFAEVLGRMIPNVETTAISSETFVGRTAVVTLGEARMDKPTEARLRDAHGQVHYLLVEPDPPATVLSQGDVVLLVGRRNHIFLAIPAPSDALVDRERHQ